MTNLTVKEIDALANIIAGERIGRSSTKEKAIGRFTLMAKQNRFKAAVIKTILTAKFDAAQDIVKSAMEEVEQPEPVAAPAPKAKKPVREKAEIVSVNRIEDIVSAPTAAPAEKPKDGLSFSAADMQSAKRVAPRNWQIVKGDVTAHIEHAKETGMFVCTVKMGGREVTGVAKSYASAIRRAAEAFNA